jgi:uncharacterized protein YkwD
MLKLVITCLKYLLPTSIIALFISADNNYNTYINAYLAQKTIYADSAYTTHTPIFNANEASQTKVTPFGTIDNHLLNACIVYHTNVYRVKMKKQPLKFSKALRNAAAFHALQMNERNFYNHMNNGVKQMKTPQLRMKFFDYPGEYVGENITKTFAIDYKEGQPYDKRENTFHYTTGKQDTVPYLSYDALAAYIVESWIKSPPHKKNMLDINYTHIGCAAIIETKSLGGRNMPNMLAVQNFGGDAPFNPLMDK